jgi:hypothetical protein
MIIKTLTTEEMMHDLICDEYAHWSPQGARALVEYWEDLSEDIGEDLEWDRAEMRCSFSEFTSWDDVCCSYEMDEEEIRHRTVVIEFGNSGVILQEF